MEGLFSTSLSLGRVLQHEIRLPDSTDLAMYDEWLPLNVAGVHRTLVEMSYFDRRPDIAVGPSALDCSRRPHITSRAPETGSSRMSPPGARTFSQVLRN